MVILGLIVLLLCVLLFTPLRYRVQASCKGKLSTLDAGADFSLFFHLVSGQVRYQNEQLHWNVRVAWKHLGSEAVGMEAAEDTAEMLADEIAEPEAAEKMSEIAEKDSAVVPAAEEAKPESEESAGSGKNTVTEPEAEEAKAEGKEFAGSGKNSVTELEDEEAKAEGKEFAGGIKDTIDEPETEEAVGSCQNATKESQKPVPHSAPQEEKAVPPRKSQEESTGLGEKITRIFEKMKYTFGQFCDKIKELLRKKEILMEFIKDEAHQAALFQGLKELKRLIRRLKPKKFSADIHFGFEDPSNTGYALAGISMIYPLIGEQVNVQPDFEQKVLEGSLFIKGHVRARIFAAFVWNMLLNQNVRTLIRDIKNFSFDA